MLTIHLTTTGLEDEHLKLFKTQLLISYLSLLEHDT